jgi:hypothetical protein
MEHELAAHMALLHLSRPLRAFSRGMTSSILTLRLPASKSFASWSSRAPEACDEIVGADAGGHLIDGCVGDGRRGAAAGPERFGCFARQVALQVTRVACRDCSVEAVKANRVEDGVDGRTTSRFSCDIVYVLRSVVVGLSDIVLAVSRPRPLVASLRRLENERRRACER